jgi:hypothetical protein
LHKQQDPLSASSLAHRTFEITDIIDWALVDFADDISGLQSHLIRGTPGLHFYDQYAFGRT